MRTTITLDKDVAARLEQLRKDRPFKDLVNEAIRRGLEALEPGDDDATPYRIRPVKGRPRRVDLDNVSQVLAELEGDAYP